MTPCEESSHTPGPSEGVELEGASQLFIYFLVDEKYIIYLIYIGMCICGIHVFLGKYSQRIEGRFDQRFPFLKSKFAISKIVFLYQLRININ